MAKQRKRSQDPITDARESVKSSWMLAKHRDGMSEAYIPTAGDSLSAKQGYNAGLKGEKLRFPVEQADSYFKTMYETGQAVRESNRGNVQGMDYESLNIKNSVIDRYNRNK